jgi:hypothetical protein
MVNTGIIADNAKKEVDSPENPKPLENMPREMVRK